MKQQINNYLNDMYRQGYSPNTIKSYKYALSTLQDYDIKEINTLDLMSIIGKEWTTNTAVSRQSMIKSFFKWLYEKGEIIYNPAEELGKIEKEQMQEIIINRSEVEEIFIVINDLPIAPQTFLYMMYDTGLPIDDMLSLNVENIKINQDSYILTPQQLVINNKKTAELLRQLVKSKNLKEPLF